MQHGILLDLRSIKKLHRASWTVESTDWTASDIAGLLHEWSKDITSGIDLCGFAYWSLFKLGHSVLPSIIWWAYRPCPIPTPISAFVWNNLYFVSYNESVQKRSTEYILWYFWFLSKISFRSDLDENKKNSDGFSLMKIFKPTENSIISAKLIGR